MSETRPSYSTQLIQKFMGYGNPKYTPIPDLFLDEQMQDLTEAELKVILYIFRRTFGFKKEQDAISYDQFLNGINSPGRQPARSWHRHQRNQPPHRPQKPSRARLHLQAL
jgi:hypothetical protein